MRQSGGPGLGSKRRARRDERARRFGARHPRLALGIVGTLLAGIAALCGFQLSYGAYLGRGWMVAAVAGMAAAAGLSAVALISNRRHSPLAGFALVAWLLISTVSISAIGYPFPQGPYGGGQAFFNVVHAFLLGYEAVTLTALVALFAYLIPRARRSRS